MKQQYHHILFTETVWQSILADIFSILAFVLPLVVNYYLLGNNWINTVFFLILGSVYLINRINKKAIKFKSKLDLFHYLNPKKRSCYEIYGWDKVSDEEFDTTPEELRGNWQGILGDYFKPSVGNISLEFALDGLEDEIRAEYEPNIDISEIEDYSEVWMKLMSFGFSEDQKEIYVGEPNQVQSFTSFPVECIINHKPNIFINIDGKKYLKSDFEKLKPIE